MDNLAIIQYCMRNWDTYIEIISAKTFLSMFQLICYFSSVHSLSHVQLCDPMDVSMPGFPVLHYLPEFAQTHVHWVDDAIQPSHPLPPPSPFAFNHSQHQGLFQWVSSLHQVAKVQELQLQIHGYLLYRQTPPDSGSWFPRAIHSTEESLKVESLTFLSVKIYFLINSKYRF